MFPFLKAVNQRFHKAYKKWAAYNYKNEDHEVSPSLWITSVHDITIGPLFNALRIPVKRKVPYASRVIFELWVSKRNPSCPYFRLLLNGESITHHLSFCNIKNPEYTLCKLSLFDQFLKYEFLQRFNADTYENACTV